jgi:glutaredoxin
MTDADPRVVVVSKAGCHLCEAAEAAVAAVCDPIGVPWATRDLADVSPTDQTRWAELIPVVLVDGAVHEVLRVDPERLRRVLA